LDGTSHEQDGSERNETTTINLHRHSQATLDSINKGTANSASAIQVWRAKDPCWSCPSRFLVSRNTKLDNQSGKKKSSLHYACEENLKPTAHWRQGPVCYQKPHFLVATTLLFLVKGRMPFSLIWLVKRAFCCHPFLVTLHPNSRYPAVRVLRSHKNA
jgi:hypothetical protein